MLSTLDFASCGVWGNKTQAAGRQGGSLPAVGTEWALSRWGHTMSVFVHIWTCMEEREEEVVMQARAGVPRSSGMAWSCACVCSVLKELHL